MNRKRFERFAASVAGLPGCPSVTPKLFQRFEDANKADLARMELTNFQRMTIEAELQNTPGTGVKEIIAHSLINSPHVPPMGIKLTESMRQEFAEEADRCGEGMYDRNELLKLSDTELAKTYLQAIWDYTQSQGGS
jgi:hypothetical protein